MFNLYEYFSTKFNKEFILFIKNNLQLNSNLNNLSHNKLITISDVNNNSDIEWNYNYLS